MHATQGRRQSISPDGRRYAVVVDGDAAIVFNASDDAEVARVPVAPAVGYVHFDASGERLLHKSGDRLIGTMIKPPHESSVVAKLPSADGGEIKDVSPDGRYAAVWIYTKGLLVADLRDGTIAAGFNEPRGETPMRFLSNHEIAARGADGWLEVRECPSGATTLRIAPDPEYQHYDAMLTPDRRSLVVARLDSTLSLHDFATGEAKARSERVNMFTGSCSMTPDGSRVITLGEGGLMRSYEVPSMRMICSMRLSPVWADGLLSRDGRSFICFSLDGSVLTLRAPNVE